VSDSEDLVPPASSRKPRSVRDSLPLDDGLPGIIDPDALPAPESEEREPTSRKLTSVRGTAMDADVEDFAQWEIDGITAEPPSTRKAGWPVLDTKTPTDEARVMIGRKLGDTDGVAPDVVRRMLPETELVALVSSTRAQRPATFGELLDAALELGE
jgi:hypothetical protein